MPSTASNPSTPAMASTTPPPPAASSPPPPPLDDVVFVMEDTASAGPYLQELRANYVLPTLDHFSSSAAAARINCLGGGCEEGFGGFFGVYGNWEEAKGAGTYTLVTYQAADCLER